MPKGTGLDAGTTVLFTLYSLSIIVTGAWGYAIIPKDCTSTTLLKNLRVLITCGAIMMTAYIGFGMCTHMCETEINKFPTSLLVFTFIMSLVTLGAQISVLSQFSKSNNSACRTSKTYSNYKLFSKIMLIFPIVMILVLIGIVWSRAKEAADNFAKTLKPAL